MVINTRKVNVRYPSKFLGTAYSKKKTVLRLIMAEEATIAS